MLGKSILEKVEISAFTITSVRKNVYTGEMDGTFVFQGKCKTQTFQKNFERRKLGKNE